MSLEHVLTLPEVNYKPNFIQSHQKLPKPCSYINITFKWPLSRQDLLVGSLSAAPIGM